MFPTPFVWNIKAYIGHWALEVGEPRKFSLRDVNFESGQENWNPVSNKKSI